MRRILPTCLAATVLLVATPAEAAWVFTGQFSGLNEAPANASPATGMVTVTINDARDTISISANFSGLTAPTTAAHIHCCTGFPGVNTGVAIETPSLPGFPLGVTSGSFGNSFNLLDPASYNPVFVIANGGTGESARNALFAGMLAGGSYFNIHTQAFPGGEIRAQLAYVPEPGTWAMMVLGFGVLGAGMRRRRELAFFRS